ncbi:TPA: hypothetical protein ACYE41_002690 [Klebsiella pneumoniae]|uniref:hypothetical protein n=1 Tax=Klebsiella pneumoniae TaxID=573 RepID=UPI000B950567|nr:hypothetical protein [Klebsiella pneumoniae]HCA4361273.1 hypothetical protein [Klebsiella quasipneumoniae subsp. similipneumoniae]MBK3307394.1 hypothetical protein [Klebsiella pneumoniae]MCI7828783.1 hypothetical protein [Klebsiella pneumoniae]MCI7864739.1 hypothetical protein [Klebsiella pneumoniae]MDZ1741498.1 hypothetical protein [Klebsiella pneumoniae]
MEQLQRLAEAIAETYIRDLRRETGGNVITVDGVSGNVEKNLLAAGLVDNSVSAAKDQYGATFEREAYQMLLRLISLDGQEYRLTEHGRHVITVMNTISLKKNKVRTMH